MRGEQHSFLSKQTGCIGSPPLARGTDLCFSINNRILRITPACAGNSVLRYASQNVFWDHPRLRGEQHGLRHKLHGGAGSPPLARGTEKSRNLFTVELGITPACAGNSYHKVTEAQRNRDHPRLRGEQKVKLVTTTWDKGSPPLARGTVYNIIRNNSRVRITPACAGNSSNAPCNCSAL